MASPIVTRLADMAAAQPGHPAIDQDGRVVSYGDFWDRVCRLAGAFAQTAAQPRVIIQAEPSANVYAAMFAALMAGGFYVPLNAQTGAARLEAAFEDIEPDIVVSDASTIAATPDILSGGIKRHVLDDLVADAAPLAQPRDAHRLAYVIFTSGSTGRPKGVMVSQDALNHYIQWAGRDMMVTPADRWSQQPNLGFDLSALDTYGALSFGATLCPIASTLDRMLPARAVKRLGITIWHSVPSVAAMMLKGGEWTADNMASLRLATFCGEALLKEHLDGIFAAQPHLRVHNTYGPTEATISCTLLALFADNYDKHCDGSVAIGDGIDAMEILLVSPDGALADEGEIVITGPQLADGYWKDAEKTAKAFRPLPFDKNRRGYFTGDWAQRTDKGVFFRERLDNQVKINGHRIELGEISALVRSVGYVNAETICHDDKLICLVEGADTREARAQIDAATKSRLENYMQPSDIVFFDTFPRNVNDKIDLGELKRLWRQSLRD